MAFDIKRFAVDELLAMPLDEKKRFLEKNEMKEPGKYRDFPALADASVVDKVLKGDYRGDIAAKDGKKWTVDLRINGQMEQDHFNGELAVEIFNGAMQSVARSNTTGPLDEHVRVVDEGDRPSLLIVPSTGDENSKAFQIFVGSENRSILMGTYYERQDNGSFEPLGPFVLKRSNGESSN